MRELRPFLRDGEFAVLLRRLARNPKWESAICRNLLDS